MNDRIRKEGSKSNRNEEEGAGFIRAYPIYRGQSVSCGPLPKVGYSKVTGIPCPARIPHTGIIFEGTFRCRSPGFRGRMAKP